MGVYDYWSLSFHAGHKIVVTLYIKDLEPIATAIECLTCNEVLLDYDKPEEDEE